MTMPQDEVEAMERVPADETFERLIVPAFKYLRRKGYVEEALKLIDLSVQVDRAALKRCPHKLDREKEWCEPCFRSEQRKRWGYSPYDYCDYLGRANG